MVHLSQLGRDDWETPYHAPTRQKQAKSAMGTQASPALGMAHIPSLLVPGTRGTCARAKYRLGRGAFFFGTRSGIAESALRPKDAAHGQALRALQANLPGSTMQERTGWKEHTHRGA